MFNQVILIGKLKNIYEEDKDTFIEIEVKRPFKNTKGEYDIDLIKCKLWNSFNLESLKQLNKESIIAIKGYIQYDNGVIIEKVTFIEEPQKYSSGGGKHRLFSSKGEL